MASFADKLKKGMGINPEHPDPDDLEIQEEDFSKEPSAQEAKALGFGAEENEFETEENPEQISEVEAKPEKTIDFNVSQPNTESKSESEISAQVSPVKGKRGRPRKIAPPSGQNPPIQENKIEETHEEIEFSEKNGEVKKKWFEAEGKLALDMIQTDSEIILQAAIAGVGPDSLDIAVENDILTIRGRRDNPFIESGSYVLKECFWGSFSRKLMLPEDTDPGRIQASMKEGVLMIRIPRVVKETKKKIRIT